MNAKITRADVANSDLIAFYIKRDLPLRRIVKRVLSPVIKRYRFLLGWIFVMRLNLSLKLHKKVLAKNGFDPSMRFSFHQNQSDSTQWFVITKNRFDITSLSDGSFPRHHWTEIPAECHLFLEQVFAGVKVMYLCGAVGKMYYLNVGPDMYILMTCPENDDWYDTAAMLQAKRVLREKHPGIPIRLIWPFAEWDGTTNDSIYGNG